MSDTIGGASSVPGAASTTGGAASTVGGASTIDGGASTVGGGASTVGGAASTPGGADSVTGTTIANPAQPNAPTVVTERPDASAFKPKDTDAVVGVPAAYPKMRYHPVHGGVTVNSAEDEAYLQPPSDWFDSAELADAARTHTEAEAVRTNNQLAKLKQLDEQGHPVVRNSASADESVRRAQAEPL